MLSDAQLKFTAETFANIGLLFFGSMVVPIFTETIIPPVIFITGLLLSLVFWFGGLFIINEVKS